jgi:enterochelin esterase-like enzyme
LSSFFSRLFSSSVDIKIQSEQDFYSSFLHRKVEVDIYLPDDYKPQSKLSYPLLIINDGQDLRRMDFAAILSRLYRKRMIPKIIVVGVYASSDRIREYGTARQPDYKGRGDWAGKYSDFILHELCPYLEEHFAVSTIAAERAIAGFSLGALSAFDIAWAHPEKFGHVGVFSGALWWRWSAVRPEDPDADRIMHDIVKQSERIEPNQFYWFECGTQDEEEDRNNNGIIDAIDDTLDLIKVLRSKGVHESQIQYLEIKDGRHEPDTWGEAMPDFLRWAFVPKPTFNA